jgi:hypothetical protein
MRDAVIVFPAQGIRYPERTGRSQETTGEKSIVWRHPRTHGMNAHAEFAGSAQQPAHADLRK